MEQYFKFFYKIYLLYIYKTKDIKKIFITSYSGIFFIRLFMAAVQYNEKSKFIHLTHGDVEVLNQQPDIFSDGSLLCNLQISKTEKYNFKLKKFLSKLNLLSVPKFFLIEIKIISTLKI